LKSLLRRVNSRFSLAVAPVVAILFALAFPTHAQETDPVEAGRNALRDSANYPWYDRETDDLRDLDAKTKEGEDSETRKKGWEWEVRPSQPSNTSWNWQFPPLVTIFQYTAMALLAVLIIVLVFLLIRYFLKEEELGTPGAEVKFEDREAEIDRVEQLPFVVRRPGGDFLSEARALYEQGRYGEAIIYLYSYELVQLDRHQHIHLAKGKTNRQYLREVRNEPVLRGILHRTMITFEDVFFGRHNLDRARFEECWQRLDEFHGALEQGALA
jgi:hypothetical protein